MYLLGIVLVLGCLGAIVRGAPRVVGGRDAPNHKYPYLVSLRDFNIGHFCSGSILNENWILTAAHCVSGRDPKTYVISAGTNYLDVPGDVYSPRFSIIHEKFENFYFKDIALIRVSNKITFNDFVKPIAIADVDTENYAISAPFAGWGSTRIGGGTSTSLQEIHLKIVAIEECKKLRVATDDTHICTYNKVSEGICHADSGGPLVLDGLQIGIASYIVPCAAGIPDVFTRVYPYNKWIETTMERFDKDS